MLRKKKIINCCQLHEQLYGLSHSNHFFRLHPSRNSPERSGCHRLRPRRVLWADAYCCIGGGRRCLLFSFLLSLSDVVLNHGEDYIFQSRFEVHQLSYCFHSEDQIIHPPKRSRVWCQRLPLRYLAYSARDNRQEYGGKIVMKAFQIFFCLEALQILHYLPHSRPDVFFNRSGTLWGGRFRFCSFGNTLDTFGAPGPLSVLILKHLEILEFKCV